MLTESQRAALTARLRQGRAAAPARLPRRGAGQNENLPLSFAQEQLWFIDQFAPGQPTYNIPQALRLTGPVKTTELASALSLLVKRHEALRTRLVVGPRGHPVQAIDEPAPVRLGVVDLAGLAPAERHARLREFLDAESVRPFSLADGPLLRADLITLGRDDHVLLLIFHHVIFDGWSAGVLVRELAALYRQEATGTPAQLPDLPIQYADYALAERDASGRSGRDVVSARGDDPPEPSDASTSSEDYWREVLAGVPIVRFPADRPRPAVDEFAGGLAYRKTDRELLVGLSELSGRRGSTLFVTLLAGLAALLVRYTGQDDLVIGTVTANRGRPELAPLIGFLVNTLPIRIDAFGDPPFTDLIDRAREAVVGAFAHQDLPFARIVAAAQVPRDPSRGPLFQIALTYAERDFAPVRAADVGFVLTDMITGITSAKFDLDFTIESRSDGLWIECSYKTALFDAEKVRGLLVHYEVLLRGILANPSARISRLPLLTPAELDAEFAVWNETAASYPLVCVHGGFEAQARRSPSAIAAEFGRDRISYAELNDRANAIAGRLLDHGVGPECLVGVCMAASIARLAALLGIWKAAGGYVPLDPALPADRLAYMVTDTGMTVILTDAPSASQVPFVSAVTVLIVPAEFATPARAQSPSPSRARPAPGNVAYVIYTSGSTGRPKGVVVEHRQAANFLYGMIDLWQVGPSDRVLQFASLNFDASVQEMFMPLLAGGRVVLAPPDTLHTPARLIALLRDRAVTFAALTPSVVSLLGDEQLPDLRVLMCGGEELPSGLVASWLRPGLAFANDYGPTETAVTALSMRLAADTPLPPPIGRPSPNYQAYVLDRHLNPVPPGVIGELYIGGLGVARGYLRRPALTGERFVPDPFQPNGRLYKTGDLGYRRRDGSIVFTGRTDHQVKLRGLRIELGEIESALAACPGIAQAVVTVTIDPAGEKELTGYLRLDPGAAAADPAAIRARLAASLPGYMIPTHLVTMAEFPLNASGKIDRPALADPARDVEPVGAGGRSGMSVPATATERVLTEIFAAVLSGAQVGATDDFFDCGGNSLQIMRLIDLVAKRARADLTPAAVFLYPTPRRLAAHIDAAAAAPVPAASPATDLIPLTQDADHAALTGVPALVLIHPVGGTVTDYTMLAAELSATSIVRGLQAPGLASAAAAATTLTALVEHYAGLITAAQPDGPYRLGGWSMGGVLAYEITRLLERDGAAVDRLVLLDPPYAVPVVRNLTRGEVAGHFLADVNASLGRDHAGRPEPATASPAAQLRWLADHLTADKDEGDPVAAGSLVAGLSRRFEVFARHTELLGGYRPSDSGVVRAPALLVTASRSLNASASVCWRRHLCGPAETLVLDCDHYELLRQPLVSAVATAIGTLGGG